MSIPLAVPPPHTTVAIGSHTSCAVQLLDDAEVYPRHCELSRGHGEVQLYAQARTMLQRNGRRFRIEGIETLRSGDVIVVGSTELHWQG